MVNKIKKLMEDYKKDIRENFPSHSHDLINSLFKHPYTKIDFLERALKIHRNTSASYLNSLAEHGLLSKFKIGKSNYHINESLLKILKER